MKTKVFGLIFLALLGCGEGAKVDLRAIGTNAVVENLCSGQPSLLITVKTANLPPQKVRGYINNVLAFDECTNPNTGFTFYRPSTVSTDGTYHVLLYSNTPSAFPYPQPSAQLDMKIEVLSACGSSVLQTFNRAILLNDNQGCYSATTSL